MNLNNSKRSDKKQEIVYDTFRMKSNENASSNIFSQNLELDYPIENRLENNNLYDNNNEIYQGNQLQNNYSTGQYAVEEIDLNENEENDLQNNNQNEEGKVEIFEDIENHIEEINDLELEEHQNNKDEL